MSTTGIIRLAKVDFSALTPPPTNEFLIGVDLDGLPKLKRTSDTIILGASASNITEYYTVTFAQFSNLVSISGLQPGGVYLITDFKTIHYIQYTDSNGDGTALDEVVNTASSEPLVVLAISNSSYSHDVKSPSNPGDDIKWTHIVDDRVLDHSSSSKGAIYYRRSSLANERGYDFRSVIFRRWNNGSGEYNVIRKIDAPVPGDYINRYAFEESYELNNNNVVKSNISATQSVGYYMDNLVMSTASLISENTINDAHGVHIGGTFNNNTFNNIRYTVFGPSSSVAANDVYVMVGSYISDNFYTNQLKGVTGSTFSNVFQNNIVSLLHDSVLGTSSDNTISRIDNCSVDILSYNDGNILRDSNITTLDKNSFNKIDNTNSTTIDNNIINYISNNSVGFITNNILNTLTGNTASYIGYNNSNYITDNSTGTVSNNQVLNIKKNDNSGVIEWNQATSIFDNDANILDISYNNCGVIATNSGTGSISYNTSQEIINNSNDGDIDYNKVTIISLNTNTDDITSNIGSIITLNSGAQITDNIVNQIVGNSNRGGGKGIQQNIAYDITSNQSMGIIENSVISIRFNDLYKISDNIGAELNTNIGYTYSYSWNIINDCENNNLEGGFTRNKASWVRNNTGTIQSNNSYRIEGNYATISNNTVAWIMSNTSSRIDRNIGMTVSNNAAVITNNKVNTIQYNTVDTHNNQGLEVTNNSPKTSASNISGNNVTRIYDNNVGQIYNNTGNNINNNNSNDTIDNNNVASIESNVNFGSLRYNTGNNISGNSFTSTLYSGATATFSYALTGTPSIGDIATISYSIYSQGVVCSTASKDGFINQLYGLFPNAGFTATYSNDVFTLTAPTTATSYENELLTVDVQGTQSAIINTSFSGSGKNDLIVDATGYTESSTTHYLVVISATFGVTPDRYDWFDDKGNSGTGITVSLTNYALSYGAEISFGGFNNHDLADNWDFDIVPNQSSFGPTFSEIFTGETVATFSDVSYNNVNNISNNSLCQIKWNNANTIKGNSYVLDIQRNNINRIEDNTGFMMLANSSGNRIINSTGSSVSLFDGNKNVDISASLVRGNILNHTFLSSLESVGSMTPSNAMGWSTQSTTSRYLVDADAHYEEIVNLSGVTWSALI